MAYWPRVRSKPCSISGTTQRALCIYIRYVPTTTIFTILQDLDAKRGVGFGFVSPDCRERLTQERAKCPAYGNPAYGLSDSIRLPLWYPSEPGPTNAQSA